MSRNNYQTWAKEDLIQEIKRLKKRKKYGIVWEEEKTKERFEADAEGKLPVLVEDRKREIITDADKPVNILIEGDNYHALSVLNYTHPKSIDVIYIDPPYNTGNRDFIFNDRYVDKEDGYRHSKWLSFMNKRLRLAKNVLKQSGIIFISVDENEMAKLRLLMDDIFGENNFVGTFIWRKKEGGGQTDTYFVTEHEYLVVYARSKEFQWKDEIVSVNEGKFNKEDERGKFSAVKLAKWGSGARREDRPKMYFSIKSPDNTNIYPKTPDGREGRWRVGKNRMEDLIEKDLIFWEKKNGGWIPYEKVYYSEGSVKRIKERSILYDMATTGDATNELKEIFGIKDVFQNPKPTDLIKFLITHTTNENAIILDFMGGSGTTGHAILRHNAEDNGNRQFILCTNNENNICTDVCYPRLQKVIKGYKNSRSEKVAGLGGNLKYFKTSFVSSEPTHRNKKLLTDKSVEMLCIKENTFEEVVNKKQYRIFKNKEKYLAILFDEMQIDAFKKEIGRLKLPVSVYVFSLEGDDFREDFEDLGNKITLCSIPAALLKVYRRIFR